MACDQGIVFQMRRALTGSTQIRIHVKQRGPGLNTVCHPTSGRLANQPAESNAEIATEQERAVAQLHGRAIARLDAYLPLALQVKPAVRNPKRRPIGEKDEVLPSRGWSILAGLMQLQPLQHQRGGGLEKWDAC